MSLVRRDDSIDPIEIASSVAAPQAIEHARAELLEQLDNWLEIPMLVLGFVWLGLLVIELTWGLTPLLENLSLLIWGIFLLDFAVKFVLAPHKWTYIKHNWLTVFALAMPALRVFRTVRVLRLFGTARAIRSVWLLRVLTSLNRGVKSLRSSMGRRGLGYVSAVTAVVAVGGAAAMYAFENGEPGGFTSLGEAFWWTAMILTTMGSAYWPQTVEGRILCFLLALYAFAVFGYVTAALASFFIGRDADDDAAEIAGTRSILELRQEIAGLREEIRRLRPTQAEGQNQ